MNKLFVFLSKYWKASQPFGWMGVIVAYFSVVTLYTRGWLLVLLYLFNPMCFRVCYQLWARRKQLDELIDFTAIGIRARREEREAKKKAKDKIPKNS